MSNYMTYGIIFIILLALELLYFRIADRCNIIDKPNERSSHSTIVLRGGGIIFMLGLWIWEIASLVSGGFTGFQEVSGIQYPWFLLAVTLIAGVSFVDDIRSLPDSVRLVAQFVAMGLTLYELYCMPGQFLENAPWWMLSAFVVMGLIIFVGASNIINFMDGINGITGGYALASLIPIYILNKEIGFVEESLVMTVILADIVFCLFNFRPKGKAKCFAGDVGSIGVAFILLFLIGQLIMRTGDVTYLIFLLVYGVDGCLTICHRIMLHENLGEAHRKHAYQLMANELKIGHVKVSLLYMGLQLLISLGFVYLVPDTVLAHWIYLVCALLILAVAYVAFMKKYYHLHQAYLDEIKRLKNYG